MTEDQHEHSHEASEHAHDHQDGTCSHGHSNLKGFEKPDHHSDAFKAEAVTSEDDHRHHHCTHDHHHDHFIEGTVEPDGPIKAGLIQLFSKAKDTISPVKTTLADTQAARYISEQVENLKNTKTGKALGNIPKRYGVLGASFAAAASTYMVSPDQIGLNIAAIAAGFYLMHHTSEYALSDIETLGAKAGWSAMGMGVVSGLVHSANEAAVSITSVVHQNTDLALSAVVSHQPFHTLGILGAVAAIAGVTKDKEKKRFLGVQFNAMNFLTVGTAALAGQIWAGELWGGLGAAALASGGLFLYSRVKEGAACSHDHDHDHGGMACAHDHGHGHDHQHEEKNALERYFNQKIPKIYSGGKALLSLGALMGVSHFTVKNAVLMTQDINLSPAQLGVVIAAGAALSEGYLSIRAALKNKSSFAFGNIMGCNITNTMLIGGGLGAASLGVNGLDGLQIEPLSEWIAQNLDYLKEIAIPDSLNPKTLSGAFHTGVFVGAPLLAATMMAMNDGKISKRQGEILAGAFALYLMGSSYLGSPCHQHVYGDLVIQHCPVNAEEEQNFLDTDLPVLDLDALD